ncbi:MAG: hypothetical protein AB3N16_12005, partial [Flavobacteriaceae bacterium]
MKRSLFYCALILLISCSTGDDTSTTSPVVEPEEDSSLYILFIGNSHTYFNQGVYSHLEEMTSQINIDPMPTIESVTFSGYSLQDHVNSSIT